MPVSEGGFPHPVVALMLAGQGPAPDVPCHKTVMGLEPGGLVIVPWLDGEMLQFIVVPAGAPLRVYVPVPSTQTFIVPVMFPIAATKTFFITAVDGQGGAPFAASTTDIVPDRAVH